MPKNAKFLFLKYIKVLEFFRNNETFLNKGTKHKNNYMEGPNSKNRNKNIKGGGFP